MTNETRNLVHPNDTIDTPQISRLKRLWWDAYNAQREYAHLLTSCAPLLHEIEDILQVLIADAEARNLPSIASLNPREPLPRDSEGKPKGTPKLSVTHGHPVAIDVDTEASQFATPQNRKSERARINHFVNSTVRHIQP
jgi:hypothetical protein